MALLGVFNHKTTQISQAMTQKIRDASPSWRLPSAEGLDWQNLDQRFGYLKSADVTVAQADLDGRSMLRDSILSLCMEAGRFLGACHQYVAADPATFEKYWESQLQSMMYDSFYHFDYFMARQRWTVDDLKTQLSRLDFQQAESDRAAQEAQKQQDGTCWDVFTKPMFWYIAG